LLSFIFAQIYFPTYSNGLKEVAGWLGLKWPCPELSGLKAICWRDNWQKSNDPRRRHPETPDVANGVGPQAVLDGYFPGG